MNVSLAIDRLVLALSVLAVSLGIAIATPAVQVLPDVADTTPVVVPAIRAALGTNRPTMHAIRVPDGFIKIDGYTDDWLRLGPALFLSQASAAGDAHLLAQVPARGAVLGPSDLSMIASAACDSKYLYITADVSDNVLLNYGDDQHPWVGDDFEIFIDANDPTGRYRDAINENDGHYTVVPPNVNLHYPKGLVYSTGRTDGIQCAARLRPFGYTIECAIPKALLPNWAAHPDMDSVGFDLQVNDADAPGLIGHDPADKAILCLLSPDVHYRTSALLGQLDFDSAAPPLAPPAASHPRSVRELLDALKRDDAADAYSVAQDVLDRIDDPDIARIAAAASLSKHPPVVKAAALIYARRELMQVPDFAFGSLVPPADGDASAPADSYYSYALIALAERRQLKPSPLFDSYMSLTDHALQLTCIWCCGINNDTTVVPQLARAYANSSGPLKQTIAWSLGMLGDPTGAATLMDAARNDPKSAYGQDATAMLKQMGLWYEK